MQLFKVWLHETTFNCYLTNDSIDSLKDKDLRGLKNAVLCSSEPNGFKYFAGTKQTTVVSLITNYSA